MRPPPIVELSSAQLPEFGLVHLSPPFASPPSATTPTTACVSHTCRWWPYSGSREFEANAAMVIIILLSALICALGINAAIRCFIRTGDGSDSSQRRRDDDDHLPQTQQELEQEQKSNVVVGSRLEAAPAVVYTAEMKAKLAGVEAECAICLSEFVEGERIRVLGRCKHGFHAQCVQEWLSSHSSCPTCRGTCLPPSPSPPPRPPPPQSTVDHCPQQNPLPESGP